ncbi:MAG: metal-dependent hydrolase [Acidimicrobiia bacterium]|nr:metal-dependent hydrolase [Acidimicrobiia bacterium]
MALIDTPELDTPPQQSSNPERAVPTRRISFAPTLADLPKHYAGDGDLIMSHVLASLSSVFPDGEDFFVRSVRRLRHQITDPALRRQVAGFIGQEAVHGREHRELNERLAELGYPTRRIEAFTRWALTTRERIMSPKANLAATAALEHYTATLAEWLLSNEEARRQVGDAAVLDILLWHALEENEHKAVAFDVYRAVGGSERTRTITMNAITVGFIGSQLVQIVLSMAGDRATYRPRTLGASLGRLRRSAFLKRDLWRQLRDYNRPDFHPDDRDTSELLEQWRTLLFGEDGTLNERLVGGPRAA